MKTMSLHESSGLWGICRLLLAATAMAAAWVTACGRPTPGVTHQIDISYVGVCPDAANPPPKIDVKRGDRVIWQSVENDGSKKEDAVYKILFDPFVGNTIDSDRRGRAASIPINMKTAQEADYKYSVVSPDDAAGNPTCPPLDPRLRVRR